MITLQSTLSNCGSRLPLPSQFPVCRHAIHSDGKPPIEFNKTSSPLLLFEMSSALSSASYVLLVFHSQLVYEVTCRHEWGMKNAG